MQPPQVIQMLKPVREAARISIGELQAKRLEAQRGLALVDTEITWHDERRLREGEAGEKEDEQFPDQFPEVRTRNACRPHSM